MKLIKSIIVLILIVAVNLTLFSCKVVSASESEPVPDNNYELWGSIDLDWWGKYVYPSTGVNYHDHTIFLSTITVGIEPTGIYGGIFLIYSPKGGWNSDLGDEQDYFLGYHFTLLNTEINIVYYYTVAVPFEDSVSDFHVLTLCLDFPAAFGANFYLLLEQDIPVDKQVYEGGFLYQMGVKSAFTLPESLSGRGIDFDLSFAGHDGAYGAKKERVSSGALSISTTFQLSEKFSITPRINFQKRLGKRLDEGGLTQDEFWGQLNLKILF